MPAPPLDNRSITDIVRQCQELAAIYTPAWSGAAQPGEPGYEMLLLFGRLMELLIERFNRVPDKNFLSFLEMVGVEQFAGAPARAPVTFVPSKKAVDGGEVPARTQVATTQTQTANAQIFETTQPFYVTSAKLLKVVNILPAGDAYSLSTIPDAPPEADTLIDPEQVISIFDPTDSKLNNLPHTIYIESVELFGRKKPVDITIHLHTTAGGELLTADNLVFKRYNAENKQWVPISAIIPSSPPATGHIVIALPAVTGIAASEVEGRKGFWIAIEFSGDFTASTQPPTIDSITGFIAPAGGSPADVQAGAGFYNSGKLDFSKPFLPFGERPRYGDAFYIGSDVALSSEISDVTLKFEIRGYTDTELEAIFANIPSDVDLETIVEWQYFTVDGEWKTLNGAIFKRNLTINSGPPVAVDSTTASVNRDGSPSAVEDGTLFGFAPSPGSAPNSAHFTVTLPTDMGKGKVNGVESYWIRGLIKSEQPYGKEGYVIMASGSPVVVGPTFIPPVVEKLTLEYNHRSDPHAIKQIISTNNHRTESVQLVSGNGVPVFYAPYQRSIDAISFFAADSALYMAFDQGFGNRYTTLFFLLEEAPATVSSPLETGDPQIAWEYLGLDGKWRTLDVDDQTDNLTTSGTVGFLAPAETKPCNAMPLLFDTAELDNPIYWYRARLAGGHYDYPPQLHGVFLNTVMAENGVTVNEYLAGSGNGKPGQRLNLVLQPILDGELWVREPELPAQPEINKLQQEYSDASRRQGNVNAASVEVIDKRTRTDGGVDIWVRWLPVPNFLSSGSRSRHYSLDAVNGVLWFGDGENGLIPPIGKDNLIIRKLVSGGGEYANSTASTMKIKELKSSLPFVDKVFNVVGAVGGADPWTLQGTMVYGPQVVKNRRRAVSTEDYEWLVRERFSEVGKVICLPTTKPLSHGGLGFRPGAITMIVVPKGTQRIPRPTNGLLRAIEEFLKKNVLGSITSEVYAVGPDFQTVSIHAVVIPEDPRQGARVVRRVSEALDAFFHPLTGGEQGTGWSFGRSVHISEIYAEIERTDGVDFVRKANFIDDPLALSLPVSSNALVASGLHQIEAEAS